ncbi:TonB-dependent receptor [Lysobacter humi (ex Lee et al. 2017)]
MTRRPLALALGLSLTMGCHLDALGQDTPSQGTTDTPDELDRVTVTGARTERELRDIPTAVSILDGETLRAQQAVSTDILRALDVSVPGLNLSTGSRSQCLINIRGRNPSFQINGVPANQDLRPSNCNSAFQLSPFAIERVEVVRGATALFGAGAPGGIVNLITRRATSAEPEIDVAAQVSANTSKFSGTTRTELYSGVGQDRGGVDYYVGLGYQNAEGARDPNGDYIPATAFESMGLNGSVGVELSDSVRLRATATAYREDPGQEYNVDGAEVDAGVAFPRVIAVQSNPFRRESFDRQHTLAVSLEADRLAGHRLFATAFWQDQTFRQRANFQDANGGAPDFFSDDRDNSTAGLRLTLARDFSVAGSALEIEYGVDHQRNRLIRLQLDPTHPRRVIGFIAPEVTLDTTGVFAQANWSLGRTRITGGLRKEFYRGEIGTERAFEGLPGTGTPGDFRDEELLLGNLGVIFDLLPRFQLYASYNQGAEITQLGRAARRATNPGLISPEPAVSDQWEVGARGRLGPVDMTVAAFYSESEAASLLQADPSCAGQSFCPLIPLRVPQRVHGVEATAHWDASPQWGFGGVFTWQEGEIYNQALGRFIPFASDTVSPTRLTAYADWFSGSALSARLQGTYIAATDFFSTSEQSLGFVETPSVFVADATIAFETGRGQVVVGVANLLDRRYENTTASASGFVPTLAEGRRLTLGYRARF